MPLTVDDGHGDNSTMVQIIQAGNQAPQAALSATPTTGSSAGDFDARFTDPEGDNLSYS